MLSKLFKFLRSKKDNSNKVSQQELEERWKIGACDICGLKCEQMDGYNGHAGRYDFYMECCPTHTEKEVDDWTDRYFKMNEEARKRKIADI